MKLAPAQLAKHLQGALAPVYIISGDDPLLCQEAADAIRAAARQQGFDERQVFAADASFDWGTLLQAGARAPCRCLASWAGASFIGEG